jgi:hypothetical protein
MGQRQGPAFFSATAEVCKMDISSISGDNIKKVKMSIKIFFKSHFFEFSIKLEK